MDERQVAIVSGAGSGVGRSCVRLLSEAGWRVVLVGRTESKLIQVAEEFALTDAMVMDTDVSDFEAVEDLMEDVGSQMGRLDAILNVAGYVSQTEIKDMTPKVWCDTIDINLSAVMYMVRFGWDLLAKQGGVVGNVSSMASVDPFPGFAGYAAAKVGVNMLTTMIAREGEAVGIKSVGVAPGAVETAMLRGMFDEEMIPGDQTLSPDQVAELLVSCVTGEREYENGRTMTIQAGDPAVIELID